jgi:hypothetical protein
MTSRITAADVQPMQWQYGTAKRSICNSGTMLGSGFGTCLAECGFTVTC